MAESKNKIRTNEFDFKIVLSSIQSSETKYQTDKTLK